MFKKMRAYYMEFALILGAVAIVTVVMLTFSGPQTGNVFSSVTSGLGSEEPIPITKPITNEQKTTEIANGEEELTYSSLNRQIIYHARLRLQVEEPQLAAQTLSALAAQYGGYISHANLYQFDKESYQGSIQLRVNARQFEAALEAVRGLANEVLKEERSSEDVTEEYVDLQARIKNLEQLESELQHLLTEARQQNNEIEPLLTIYDKISKIREEIERHQGQLNVLSDTIALGTIDVELVPPEVIVEVVAEKWSAMRTARGSLDTLSSRLQAIADLTIYFAISTLPFLLMLGFLVYLVWLLSRWLARREYLGKTVNRQGE